MEPTSQDKPRMHNPLEALQPGEQIIFQIKRHPFGIIIVFLGMAITLALLAIIVFAVGPNIFPNADKGTYNSIASVGFLIFTFLAVAFTAIANYVYWGNSWILTSDSITQVVQISLFNRQSGQLSLENLEDVAVEKHGIFAHIFDFGTLKAQTAAEHSKFYFYYCATPNFYAQKILQAREAFEQGGRYEGEHYQKGTVTPGSVQFTGQPKATIPQDNNQA